MQVQVFEFVILLLNYTLIHRIIAQKLCHEKPPNDMVSCTKRGKKNIANCIFISSSDKKITKNSKLSKKIYAKLISVKGSERLLQIANTLRYAIG